MQCGAAHAVAPTSSAAPHSSVSIAEVADVVHPTERCTPMLEGRVQAGVIVPTLPGWLWVRFLLGAGCLNDICLVIICLVCGLVKVPTSGMPSANMPTTTVRMQCGAAHAVAPTSPAAPHSSVSIAEVADMVHPTESCTPLLEGRVQAGVIVPTLLGWLWVRLLLGTGCLDDFCRLIIYLVFGLVKVPASSMPSASMPTTNMPATTVRMQRGAAHAVAPTRPAAPHSSVSIAEVADVVHPTEGCAPLLEGRVQAGVIVPPC